MSGSSTQTQRKRNLIHHIQRTLENAQENGRGGGGFCAVRGERPWIFDFVVCFIEKYSSLIDKIINFRERYTKIFKNDIENENNLNLQSICIFK